MKNIKGIIFDLDATLIDSLPLHYRAYTKTLQQYGLALTEDHYYKSIGGTSAECLPLFLGQQISPVPLKQLHQEKIVLSLEMLEQDGIRPLETAKLLEVFGKNYQMAIASAGNRAFVNKVIEIMNWSQYFAAVITGNDVRKGKPDPEAFLLAAEKMKLLPQDCIVFEDSNAGIEAAKKAGMLFFNVKKTI